MMFRRGHIPLPADRPPLPTHGDEEMAEAGSYYPPQARNPRTNKVALISNDTCPYDSFSWIPADQQHCDIGSYQRVREVLNGYLDGSIDVLVISGHQGGQCNARTLDADVHLGGPAMPDDIYDLVRKKMSSRGVIVITACHAGDSLDNVNKTCMKFCLPVVASPGWTRGNRAKFGGGGSASHPYCMTHPGTEAGRMIGAIGGAIGLPNPGGLPAAVPSLLLPSSIQSPPPPLPGEGGNGSMSPL
jgi:hypothetical protein